MADEVHGFSCVIPANTPKTAPVTIAMPLGHYEVIQLDAQVLSGPAGLMGFYLALSGQQWLPWEVGTWFVWDNQKASWPLTNQPTAQGWQLVGYNTGQYPHTVQVQFHLVVPTDATPPPPPTLTIITTAPTGSTALL